MEKIAKMEIIQTIDNANTGEMCRACFEKCGEYKMLFENAENIANRSLGDVFFDVVKIEISPDAQSSSPNRICLPCSKELISAYNFIQKSQQSHNRFLDYLRSQNIKPSDCLSEFPIDIPSEPVSSDLLQIKVEDEIMTDYTYPQDDEMFASSCSDSESDDEPLLNKKDKLNKMQCTYCSRVFKRLDFLQNHQKKHEEEIKKNEGASTEVGLKFTCDDCGLSCTSKLELKSHRIANHPASEEPANIPKTRAKRSSGRTQNRTKNVKIVSNRFECDSCNKTFAWKKDLFRHEKHHDPNNRKFVCPHCSRRFIRKDKLSSHLLVHLAGVPKRPLKSAQYFAHHLFSDRRFKEIKCMICNFEAASDVPELRRHIILHNNLELIEGLENSEVVKTFYPEKRLHEVIPLIAAQIADRELNKLYSIVNSHSYEMGISDSDQSDPDAKEPKYTCEVCNNQFNRKHKLMTHQAYEHTFDECPYSCEGCSLKFTSKPVLESHLKYHCMNPDKMLQCKKCPGRFSWPKNLDSHRCGGKKIVLDKECTTCEVCNKVFAWPRDLRIHKKTHIPDGKAHKCSVCGERFLRAQNLRGHLKKHSANVFATLKPKKLMCTLCNLEFLSIASLKFHLYTHADGQTDINFDTCEFITNFYSDPDVDRATISQYIRDCFNEQKLWQMYAAVNKFGLEMVLSDSDSENENEAKEQDPYVCELCDVKFTRMQDIMQHQLVEHDSKKTTFPYKCEKCADQFVCAAILTRHTKSECSNSDRVHECKKCGAKFMWKQNLAGHNCARDGKNGDNDKTCETCGKKFAWLKDLHRHKRSHIPTEAKFECLICDRKFNRKDNMRAHMKIHAIDYKSPKTKATLKWEQQDENLCKPHGVKEIQCKICLSKHNSIRDLANHLTTHTDQETLKHRQAEIGDITMMLYNKQMSLSALSKRIDKDLANGSHTRFYSITNESGYELSLIDSETSSDLEAEGYDDADDDEVPKGYNCLLCKKNFNRKFKMYDHQKNDHLWDELPLECTFCGLRFASDGIYSAHLKNECSNTEKQFKCKQCPMKFTWKENLKNHERVMHDKNPAVARKYPCSFCDRSFLWQKDLLRHRKTHGTLDMTFECTWCFRVFLRKDNLKIHMKVHKNATHLQLPDIYYLARPNGHKQAECKLCNKKYTTVHELLAHMQNAHAHEMFATIPNVASYSITNALGYEMDIEDSETENEVESEKYSCEICDMRFSRRFKLLQHQQALHYSDNIPHKCTFCPFKCVSKDVLSYHMRSQCLSESKQFRCTRCSMRFMWKENLDHHESLIHDSARTHNCDVCKRDFATLHDLNSHDECKPPGDVQYFECDICNRKYNRKDRLIRHVKDNHTDIKIKQRVKSAPPVDKMFLCAFCGKEVSSSSNLIIHMRRHTGEKPFKCEFCNKGFPRSSDLSCHRRTHTGERPHKCSVCEKAFSRSYKLQTHMRIHSGERPYKCKYCEKSFTQSNDLTLHVRRHTGERPYICETCGERFIQGTALRNHRRMRGHYKM